MFSDEKLFCIGGGLNRRNDVVYARSDANAKVSPVKFRVNCLTFGYYIWFSGPIFSQTTPDHNTDGILCQSMISIFCKKIILKKK